MEETRSRTQLSHQMNLQPRIDNLMQTHDVRVAKCSKDVDFIVKSLSSISVYQIFLLVNLECNLMLSLPVSSSFNYSKGPLAKE